MIAVVQTSGRPRLNIHGAIDLETGRTRILDVPTVDAVSTIQLMIALLAVHPRITHNTCDSTFHQFSDAMLTFLRNEVPRNWHRYCDEVTDHFRTTSPKDVRSLA